MSKPENRTKIRKTLRKRVQRVAQFIFTAKQLAWRLTAAWLWFYFIATIVGQRGHLSAWEDSLFLNLDRFLMNLGFTPSSPRMLPICIKLLWLFAICAFSWSQIFGFFILYTPFAPIVLLTRLALRKRLDPYQKARSESFSKARREGRVFPKRNWGFPAFFLLLLWLVLYGQTSAPYPLGLAMTLTATLFCLQVAKALTFAAPREETRWNRIEGVIASSRKFVLDTVENFKKGKIQEMKHLNWTIWTASFLLRQLRWASRWLYGKPARKRAALIVFLRFIINLAALGGISILFWAFAIKFAVTPTHLAISVALLASASHAIPGIPGPSNLHVPATIQVHDSLAAWMIFVLYAGSVASLFPKFQERAIEGTAANYMRLRTMRKAIYRLVEMLRSVQKLVIENPELEQFAKTVILLRQQTDLKPFLLSQPDYVRSLLDKPDEVSLLRNLGVPIPELPELIRELPPQPVQVSQQAGIETSADRSIVPIESNAQKPSEDLPTP